MRTIRGPVPQLGSQDRAQGFPAKPEEFTAHPPLFPMIAVGRVPLALTSQQPRAPGHAGLSPQPGPITHARSIPNSLVSPRTESPQSGPEATDAALRQRVLPHCPRLGHPIACVNRPPGPESRAGRGVQVVPNRKCNPRHQDATPLTWTGTRASDARVLIDDAHRRPSRASVSMSPIAGRARCAESSPRMPPSRWMAPLLSRQGGHPPLSGAHGCRAHPRAVAAGHGGPWGRTPSITA